MWLGHGDTESIIKKLVLKSGGGECTMYILLTTELDSLGIKVMEMGCLMAFLAIYLELIIKIVIFVTSKMTLKN